MVFYVIHYREELFSTTSMDGGTDMLRSMDTTRDNSFRAITDNTFDHSKDEDAKLNKDKVKKQTYRAFFEVKMLMNEPALKDCYFFIIINVISILS